MREKQNSNSIPNENILSFEQSQLKKLKSPEEK